jgi:hypothetical protein
MQFLPQNAETRASIRYIQCYSVQGTTTNVSGSFVTVPDKVSGQLLPSTNAVLGYGNGQMLARAKGDGTGDYAGLTEGALINWDPNSTDTGQAVWNGYIIADLSFATESDGVTPAGYLPIKTTTTAIVGVATPRARWQILQQYLYGPGTPDTDATIVNTAIINSNLCTPVPAITNASGLSAPAFNY